MSEQAGGVPHGLDGGGHVQAKVKHIVYFWFGAALGICSTGRLTMQMSLTETKHDCAPDNIAYDGGKGP
jgi:hypothetical protein